MALTEIPSELSSTPSIIDNGNATAITIDSSENSTFAGAISVAGEITANGTVNVHTASAGTVSASTQADDIVIENNAEGGMTIITPDDQSARIRFTSPSTNNDVGGAHIFYRQNINKMQIGTTVAGGVLSLVSGAGTEALVLDGSGNLLVGKSALNFATAGTEIMDHGEIQVTRASGVPMYLRRNSSDGAILSFYKDGTTVGSIGTGSGLLTIGTGTGNLVFENALVAPCSDSSVGSSNGVVDLGASSRRFRNLHISGSANIGNLLNMTDGTTNGFISTTSSLMQFGTSTSAPIVFYTGNTERVRLYASGKTVASASIAYDFIHYFQQTNASGYMLALDTAGSALAFFYKNGSTGVGSITTNGTTTSFNQTSDERAKESIVDSPSASADIDSIQVRSFDWIETGEHQKYGTIAQELQSIAPYAVYKPENSEDMMGVDYSKLVPMLIKEIQSLRTRVQKLENN